jgi:hypothetical protein
MFCLGFYFDETYDEPGWSYEFITDDFGEAIDDLFYARNYAAEGEERWEGAQLMVLVLRNGETAWEELAEESWVE